MTRTSFFTGYPDECSIWDMQNRISSLKISVVAHLKGLLCLVLAFPFAFTPVGVASAQSDQESIQRQMLLLTNCINLDASSRGLDFFNFCPFSVFMGICFEQSDPIDYSCGYALQYPGSTKVGLIPSGQSILIQVRFAGQMLTHRCISTEIPVLEAPVGIGPPIWSCR
jgi:hypothetical protein